MKSKHHIIISWVYWLILIPNFGCSDLFETENATTFQVLYPKFSDIQSTHDSAQNFIPLNIHKSLSFSSKKDSFQLDFTNDEKPSLDQLPQAKTHFKSSIIYAGIESSATLEEVCPNLPLFTKPVASQTIPVHYYSSADETIIVDDNNFNLNYSDPTIIEFDIFGLNIESAAGLENVEVSYYSAKTHLPLQNPCTSSPSTINLGKKAEHFIWLPKNIPFELSISSQSSRVLIDLSSFDENSLIFTIKDDGRMEALKTEDQTDDLMTLEESVKTLRKFVTGEYQKEAPNFVIDDKLKVTEKATVKSKIIENYSDLWTIECKTEKGSPCPPGSNMTNNEFLWTPDYHQSGEYRLIFYASTQLDPEVYQKNVVIFVDEIIQPPTITCEKYSFLGYFDETFEAKCSIVELDSTKSLKLDVQGDCEDRLAISQAGHIRAKIGKTACSAEVVASNGLTSSSVRISINPIELLLTLTATGLPPGKSIVVKVDSNSPAKAISKDQEVTFTIASGNNFNIYQIDFLDQFTCTPDTQSGQMVKENLSIALTCQDSKVIALDSGESHSCVLLDNNSVQCFGYNGDGQLGNGGDENVASLRSIPRIKALSTDERAQGVTISAITVGGYHSCILHSKGGVRCWGRNTYGQLGYGNTDPVGKTSPSEIYDRGDIPISETLKVVSIDAGMNHTCAVLENGSGLCWGRGQFGRLGDANGGENKGDESGSQFPSQISLGGPINFGQKVKTIKAGDYHSCAQLVDGKIRCFGAGVFGAIGLPSKGLEYGISESPLAEVEVLTATDLSNSVSITDIGVGAHHSCALLSDDSMRCWGRNASGQLGHNSDYTNYSVSSSLADSDNVADKPMSGPKISFASAIKSFSLGRNHTCALREDDSVICWGRGDESQLGLNSTNSIGTSANPLANDKIVFPASLTPVKVSSGGSHTCILTDLGKVYCFGEGSSGQLGNGSFNNVTDMSTISPILL